MIICSVDHGCNEWRTSSTSLVLGVRPPNPLTLIIDFLNFLRFSELTNLLVKTHELVSRDLLALQWCESVVQETSQKECQKK